MKHFTILKIILLLIVTLFSSYNNEAYSQCGFGQDNTPPTLVAGSVDIAPGLTQTVSTDINQCSYFHLAPDWDPFYVDNCPGGVTITLTLSGATNQAESVQSTLEGTIFNLGTTSVLWRFYDAATPIQNVAFFGFTVEVVDNQNPVITFCPANIGPINNDAGFCSANIDPGVPLATDNCPSIIITNDFTGGATAVGDYPVGTTTITWTATDASNNTASCQQTVTVVDNEAPTFDCPANQGPISNDLGLCSAVVLGIDPTNVVENCTVQDTTYSLTGATIASGTGSASGESFNVGITTVQYTISDINGNSTTCASFTLEVIDDEDPIISCPSETTVSTDGGVCTAEVFAIAPITSDNCAVTLQTYTISGATIASSPITGIHDASGEIFNLGTSTVTYVIEDAAGNSATCSFDVIVEDNENPVLACPSDVTLSSDPGVCDAVVAGLTILSTSDNCSLDSLTWSISGATIASSPSFGFNDASNQTFNLGVSTVTYTLTDGSGNQSTCSFTVTVEDNENPTLTCPAETVVPNDPGICGATVTGIDVVTFNDNCSVVSQTWSFSGSTTGNSPAIGFNNASGQLFNLDTTLVTYTVTDTSGNTASCSFEVIVQDTEAPTISCPGETIVSNDLGECTAIVNGIAPISADNCSVIQQTWSFSGATTGNSAATGINDASGLIFNLDTTLVTYIIVDTAGNTATCSFDVIVQDTENPIVSCPGDVDVTVDTGTCAAVVDGIEPFFYSDNCSVVSLTWNFTGATTGNSPATGFNDASSSVFNGGTTIVTYTVTDTAGNIGTCSFNVLVIDNEPPTITCPIDVVVSNDSGICGAAVIGIEPLLTDDNCAVTTQTWSFSGATISTSAPTGINDASSQIFNLDTTLVLYEVFDDAGNTASCTFEVVVQDTEAPTISCPDETIVSNDLGECTAIVNGIAPISADNCSVIEQTWSFSGATTGNSAATGINDASGNTFNLDTTLVTYFVVDTAGNSATCSFEVIVQDTEVPVVVCPSDTVVLNIDPSNCTAIVNDIAAISWVDNCSVISLTWDLSGATSGSSDPTGFNDASGQLFNQNLTLVTYTVTDTAGNLGICSFSVTILDTVAPTIICPSDISVSTDNGVCDAIVNDLTPVINDNCGVESLTWSMSQATASSSIDPFIINDISGESFNLDTTLVTYVVTDSSGNFATCSFEVIVIDTTAPVITCPSDVIVSTDPAVCEAVVNGLLPVVIENCTVTDQIWTFSGSTIGASPLFGIHDASGETFNLGTTLVTYSVTDSSGNSAACSFPVTVLDTTAPVITCPSDVIVSTDPTICEATVNELSPVVIENCTVTDQIWTFSGSTNGASPLFGIHDASGEVFSLDTTLVTYFVTDTAGFIASCSFLVIVEDTTAPIIICPSDTVVSTDINGCEAAVNGLSPVVIENCAVTDQIWTFSGSTNGASPLFGIHDASGEVFSLDTTLVTYFVTDTAGNVGTCSFNVVVNDSVLPIVICPNNIIVPTEVGFCSAVVDNINIVSASDNCSVLAHLWEFSGSTVSSSDPFGFNDASGQTFNLDTTLVTYTIIDTAGNFSTCSFEVIIVDTIFPVLVCPSDIVVSTDLTDCDAIVNNINIVSSSDNCTIVDQLWSFSGATSANSPSNGIFDASGETFNLDTTIVTYTVIDNSGNSVSCSFEVVVEDTIAPTIICPSDTIVYTTLTSCDTGVNGLSPTIDDNCTVVDQLWSFVGSTTNNSLLNGIYDASGELFNLDTTLVTYFIADNSGNTASCSFEVIVQDTVAPVLTCPADTLVGTDPGLCAAVVNGLELFVFENCSFSTQTWVIGGATVDTSSTSGINDVIGVLFNTGISIVTYTVIDTVGNTSTCQFEVNVEDTEAPVVICPSDTSVYTDPGLCETTVFGIDTVGVTDNCSAIAVLWTISGATTDNSPAFGYNDVSGQVFFGGLNTVTYAGIDAQGNVGTCSFDVTVLDTVPPVITCPFSDTIVYSSAIDCGVEVFWTEPVATDNCSFLVTSTDTSGTFFPVGLTEVTYVVTDFGGNTDQCSFEIQVVDTVIPVIIGLPSDTLIFCEFDTVTWDLPSIDEACPNVLVSSTINPGGQLPTGYTTVTYNAEDASGNFANPVSFVVYVHPLPTPAELSIYDVIACESDPYDVSITNYNTNYLYDWIYDTNILLQNDSIYNVYFAESIQSGIYDVVVTGEFGCQNVTSFNVTVDLCEISIPQGYSPNNDGINDFFVVDNILAYPGTQITIFNRWGAKVYENNDYQNQWAGESENFMNIGGDQLPEGTYYYQIVLGGFDNTPGKGKLFTGYVYLKR